MYVCMYAYLKVYIHVRMYEHVPTAIPLAPFNSSMGTLAGSTKGSISFPSKFA